ncbi:hypothetical protein [Kutzneria sp. CA-103260]|uniref:hypothetical protein n=1 Tax=Kutzneria sp. CA-103260 TaxID=2802641 RepID=UPI001BAB9E68|nr:hypothetical protein [Kutzneria sp. CA-103260]QUQ70354.1 hypothetical protein JJ691_81300 [Kutzneria sp. CA-103260]
MAIGEATVVAFSTSEAADAKIAYRVGGYGSTMTATGPWGEVTAEGRMGFDTLRALRLKLEELGWYLSVNGARYDVYCFGTIMNFTNGMYVTVMGDDSEDPYVHLFGRADPKLVWYVAGQDEFFDYYFSGIKADTERERMEQALVKWQESKA